MAGNNIVPAHVVGQPVAAAEAVAYRVVNAVSPTVTTEQITGGAVITITDLHGTHTVTLYNGADGRGIANTVLNDNYTLTITYTDGTSYTTPSIRGAQGRSIVSITKTGTSGLVDTYEITYTDGAPSTFTVTNGKNGTDGVSPTVTVEAITGGHRITITDQTGPHTVDVMDGTNGDDGISPEVTVQSITGGNRVTITDAEHPNGQSFDVMDGDPGQPGQGVPSGGTTGQVLKKSSGTDYATEWGDEPSVPVQDVQVNGSSILSNGIANVPIASGSVFGTIKVGNGLTLSSEKLVVNPATSALIKQETATYTPITPIRQHESTFYGLAKAAGDTSQSESSNAVGTYTEEAKRKIAGMLEPQFRLIKEIAITEETAIIYVNTDSNGDSFLLNEIVVYFNNVTSDNNRYGAISVNNGNSQYSSTAAFLGVYNLFSTTAQTRTAHLWRKGGKLFGEAMSGSVANEYAAMNSYITLNATGIIDCDAIHELCIGAVNANYKFTSGTIKIYGR